ncbi:MAG: propanoyl-CoA acyltransferase [Spirochaetes bacterium]|nr:propanoyl-CoA acyltransferase [Spirochaetota bacterium]
MSKASIIGAYNTKFGALVEKNKETGEVKDLKSFYDLIKEAGMGAIKDAGLSPKDIDAIWIGSCSPSMFVNQEHVAPQSGRFKRVLVIGAEKMNLLDTKGVTHALACSSYWPSEGINGMTFPGLFAEYAKGYMKHYKYSLDQLRKMLATIAALMYKNALENPLAHFGKGSPPDKLGLITADAILALPLEGKGSNPIIADPLRLHDCSLVTDGAAALVLAPTDEAKKISKKVVEIAGLGMTTERLAENVRPNMHELMAAKEAVKRSFKEAGISLKDVNMAEVHDCFTINQVLCTEAMGLSKDGQGGFDYIDGRFTQADSCPINLSGGLKAKGHPVGATGASMHALIYKQLVGEPIGCTPKKGQPEIGFVLNVGGSAVTNCATTLRRIK